jgi:hypothetical protein
VKARDTRNRLLVLLLSGKLHQRDWPNIVRGGGFARLGAPPSSPPNHTLTKHNELDAKGLEAYQNIGEPSISSSDVAAKLAECGGCSWRTLNGGQPSGLFLDIERYTLIESLV